MQNETIIRCQQLIPGQLGFDYKGKALDLELGRGEVISIIGPNYSGKGNWLRTICGLEDQSAGKVYIKGIDSSYISAEDWAKIRMSIAYLHEDTALLSAANGLMNVLIPALYHRLDEAPEKPLLAERALNLLEEIDPQIILDELPAYLSKVHQYKIAVARALLLEPDVLALNNPFAHFNSDSKHQFQVFIENQVKKGLSLMMVTHDISYALDISDKIIFVSREDLFYFDSKQAIFNCDVPIVNKFINLQGNQVNA